MRSARWIFPVLSVTASLFGCGGRQNDGANEKETIQGTQVQGVIEVPLRAEDLTALPPGFEDTAKKAGWTRTQKGFELVVPISNAVLVYGEKETSPSDPQGFLTESALPSQPGFVPSLKTRTGAIPLVRVKDPASGKTSLRLYQVFGASADCCRPSGPQVPEAVPGDPMEGRCLDYNGTYTDGQNYPKSDVRAFKNFVGSDCNLAVKAGHCFADHLNGGCYKNHGNKLCSALIGHASTYHTH